MTLQTQQGGGMTRRRVAAGFAGTLLCGTDAAVGAKADAVNGARHYPVQESGPVLDCVIDAASDRGSVDRRIFGTNLEWFNDAGGLAGSDADLRRRLVELAVAQKLSVLRFPGGTLADYYDWRDGVGPPASRPVRRHPTDPGRSANDFGTPEFLALLRETDAQGLITVNAGTGTAGQAADWVRYANAPANAARAADGWPAPAGIRLWEVGNELYLPGNPGEPKITQTPARYAAHFRDFAAAMRGADPSIAVIAIGVAGARAGPDSPFPEWTETLLREAAAEIDMIAVHNAYFPLLYDVRQPPVETVYPALWAAPEAVDRSLARLDALIARFETRRRIGIAVTEWGMLFSLPTVDPYWFDHVKTLGAGIYAARLLQVLIGQPRVMLANYFKFTDRSFMGWVGFDGRPKVPYWIFRLYAEATGGRRIAASLDSPTYDAAPVGAVPAARAVPEVTVLATRDAATGTLFVNFVNRSWGTAHRLRLRLRGGRMPAGGEVRSVSAHEPTAHNGVDIPPEWPMRPEYEPYTTAAPGSIRIMSRLWSAEELLVLPPFSVATLILRPDSGPS